MVKKKAFVSGISGMDGKSLSELLLSKDYEVYGIIRRHSIAENQDYRLRNIEDKINLDYGDLLDFSALTRLMHLIQPDEIYNLAAQSHVRISFDIPLFTIQTNALGTANMLESYRQNCPHARYYQASSSEMFGNSFDDDGFQRETTPMHPVSPYGAAKLMGFSLVKNYRHSYKLFACNGILFNHSCKFRGSNFVEQKIIKSAVEISKGLRDKLVLGNLDSFRDFGHSKDYVRAMNLILNHSEPDDFVVATGETHSIREICEYVFDKLNLKCQDHIEQDAKFMRPEELKYLKGDSTKIRSVLGWKPEYTFHQILDEMIENWQKLL
jgi:GDPmannose 4,6-dehydratase